MVKWTALALILGFLIDLSAGDPRWLYHPVRVIGNGISFLEKGLRKIFPDTPGGERIAGLFLVILISVFGGLLALRPFQQFYLASQAMTWWPSPLHLIH